MNSSSWMVYWYDTKEWNELNLTDANIYAEHLFNNEIDCILVPKKAYENPKWKSLFDEAIEREICVIPSDKTEHGPEIEV